MNYYQVQNFIADENYMGEQIEWTGSKKGDLIRQTSDQHLKIKT